eukprot:6175500-Pleurochrysis_carterae.AAC.6
MKTACHTMLALLACQIGAVSAPKMLPLYNSMRRGEDGGGTDDASNQWPSAASAAACGFATAIAAAMALRAVRAVSDPGMPLHISSGRAAGSGGTSANSDSEENVCWENLADNVDSDDCDSADEFCNEDEEAAAVSSTADGGCGDCAEPAENEKQNPRRPSKKGAGKLWGRPSFQKARMGLKSRI